MKDTGIWLLALAINRENLVAFCVSRMMTAEYPATWALMAFSANWQSPRSTTAMVCLLVTLCGMGEHNFDSSFTTLPLSCKEQKIMSQETEGKFKSLSHFVTPDAFMTSFHK